MSRPIEAGAGAGPYPAPYVHRRKIRFGHTDAARIVYTVRFFDYAMDAIEGWFDEVLGVGWYRLNTEFGVGTPFVHMDLDVQAPLTPAHRLAVTVLVKEAGRSSLRFAVAGRRDDGVLSFAGEWVCVFSDAATSRSIPIPPALAQRIADYRQRCAAAGHAPPAPRAEAAALAVDQDQ